MTKVGIIRTIDALGRVVIPAEFRNILGLEPGAQYETYMSNNEVVLKACKQKCYICGETDTDKLITNENIPICKACIVKYYKSLIQ